MCQLLGLNCSNPTDARFSFSGFFKRGGDTDHHADGWGVAFFEGKGLRHFLDHHAAVESPMANLLQSYPLKSKNLIAHVRKATTGSVCLENAHPFTRELWGRHWVIAHNGNLANYQPHLHTHFQPVGTTDSELAFCWLMQELEKSHAGLPSVHELTHTLKELAPRVSKFGTFNFLLSNGEATWAHCSTDLHYVIRQHPFSKATLKDDDWTVNFAELNHPSDRVAVICTQPLTADEPWVAFSPNELQVFVDGGLPFA